MTNAEYTYRPVLELSAADIDLSDNTRLLVLDSNCPDVLERTTRARWLDGAEVPLPKGLYDFLDADGARLVMFAPWGSAPGDTTVATGLDLTEQHALVRARDWGEHWWSSAHEVPDPAYAALNPVLQRGTGIEVTPTQRRFVNGVWTYKITVDGRTYWEREANLIPAPQDDDPESWVAQSPAPVARFAATLTRAKLRGRFADTLFSYGATRTMFRPYQFKPVMKLLETGKARLLIADEVGLGKTIEAGLVFTELEARGEADRVLIICPSSLLTKWQDEMQQRFDFELDELDRKGLDKFLVRFKDNRLPARFRYITSIERLRTWDGLDELAEDPPDLDLVIVDEAHQMRNTGTASNAMGGLLNAWSDAIIFLTATPINLRQKDLYNLLDLLVPEDLDGYEELLEQLQPNAALNALGRMLGDSAATADARVGALDALPSSRYGDYVRQRPDFARLREIAAQESLDHRDVVDARRLVADLNTLSAVVTRTRKIEVSEEKPIRDARWQTVAFTDEESRFYTEFLRWCHDRALAVGMPMYFVMQMPLRLASACLPMARRAVLAWDPELFVVDPTEDDGDAFNPSQLVEPHSELVNAAIALPASMDSKFDELLPVLTQLAADHRQALLFTFSRPTLTHLRDRLSPLFRVAVLHGGVDRETRRTVMADFRSGRYDFVLANKVASEGLDFEFCSAIINYDLPWNPMEIEQRIGRIDRIGQKEAKLLVSSFRNAETIDEDIISRVLDRIGIFEDTIGGLEPIVNSQMKILHQAFDFELSPEERTARTEQFLIAVETNKAGVQDVVDASTSLIVGNDVDVSGLKDELERSGRYVGQAELGNLLADWATIEDAPGVSISPDQRTIAVRGNSQMASRVEHLSSGKRTRREVSEYVKKLRSGIEMHFALDQDLARSGKFDLLSATNPLVVAAADVPGHREVRFTHARAPRYDESVATGTYLVALARALYQPRGEAELWATAVTFHGHVDDGPVATALLSALARGELTDPMDQLDQAALPLLTRRALDHLQARHEAESVRLESEYDATRELRRARLDEQYSRRRRSIRQRIETATSRGVRESSLRGFRGQLAKTEARHSENLERLENEPQPTIQLEPIAVCVLEVIR